MGAFCVIPSVTSLTDHSVCKDISDLEMFMDYFALSGRSCENLNIPTHLSILQPLKRLLGSSYTCFSVLMAKLFGIANNSNFKFATPLHF